MRYSGFKYLCTFLLFLSLTACVKEAVVSSTSQSHLTEIQRVALTSNAAQAEAEVIDLKQCRRKSDSAAISYASLILLPSGDMIFSGAIDSREREHLARINLSEMSMRTVSASATTSRGKTLSASTADNRTMAFYTTQHGYFVYTSPTVSYVCEPVTTASMLSTKPRPRDL